jgi:hypothetical protein
MPLTIGNPFGTLQKIWVRAIYLCLTCVL